MALESTFKLISKEEAKSKGLTRYFTGRPCIHGHVAERKVGSGNCCGCAKRITKQWQKQHKSESKRVRALQEKAAGRPRAAECEIPTCDTVGRVVFDHCHNSKKFRGWICDRCNRLLGQVKDNAVLLDKLAAYLRKEDNTPLQVNLEDLQALSKSLLKRSGIELTPRPADLMAIYYQTPEEGAWLPLSA